MIKKLELLLKELAKTRDIENKILGEIWNFIQKEKLK